MGLNVLPLMMGHEVAREVAEVGSEVQGVQPGHRITVDFYDCPPRACLYPFGYRGNLLSCRDAASANLPRPNRRNAWEILGSRANTKQELQETMEPVAQGRI
jgi:Zn-dependent alcohol dehydrogenase